MNFSGKGKLTRAILETERAKMEARKISSDAKPAKNFGPESRFFDRLKSKNISITRSDPTKPTLICTLLWVDRYTIGVQYDIGDLHPQESMIYKENICSIELA